MKTLAVGLLLAIAAYFAPLKAIEPVARVLVPAVALMATGIFPCMSLAVGAMKGEHRTPALVEQLHGRLHLVLKLLVVTFSCAVIAIGALAITVALAAVAQPVGSELPDQSLVISAHAVSAISMLVLALLAGRVVDLGRAFFAILEINRKHALLIARAKVSSEEATANERARASRFVGDDMTVRKLERA